MKSSFRLNTEAVWFCKDYPMAAREWALKTKGLVWVSHRAVGEFLDSTGIPYFSAKGETKDGLHIYDHEGPAAMSIKAMSKGFNLQVWNKNLVMCAPSGGDVWEQMIGRTHRFGQKEGVSFVTWFTSDIVRRNFGRALLDAENMGAITGNRQKLEIARYIECRR